MINDQFGYRPCPTCKAKTFYNERYDANYCKTCNIWLEDNCGDKDCFYCASRPEFPVNIKTCPELSSEFGDPDNKLLSRLYKKENDVR